MKRKRKKQKRSIFKKDILVTVLIQFKHVLFIHVLQCLPIAKLSSFCILELTPAILYKPCSSIPEGGDKRSSVTDMIRSGLYDTTKFSLKQARGDFSKGIFTSETLVPLL